MKPILHLFFFAVPFLGYSQDCKFLVNNVDEFTGKFTRGTQVYLKGNPLSGGTSLIFSQLDNEYSLVYNMAANSYNAGSDIDIQNATSFFKFEDGKVLSLKNSYGRNNSFYTEKGTGLSTLTFVFVLNESDLKLFSQVPLDKFRIGFNEDGSTGQEEDLSKKQKEKIIKAAACILK